MILQVVSGVMLLKFESRPGPSLYIWIDILGLLARLLWQLTSRPQLGYLLLLKIIIGIKFLDLVDGRIENT